VPIARSIEAISHLYDRGEPVDPVTLGDVLEHRGTLESAGGSPGSQTS
jgi:replicative DNA helicase